MTLEELLGPGTTETNSSISIPLANLPAFREPEAALPALLQREYYALVYPLIDADGEAIGLLGDNNAAVIELNVTKQSRYFMNAEPVEEIAFDFRTLADPNA